MAKKASSQTEKSVTEIAREALRLLGNKHLPATPDAYKAAYYEVAGMPPPDETPQKAAPQELPDEKKTDEEKRAAAEKKAAEEKRLAEAMGVLEDFAQQLIRLHNETSDYGHHLLEAIQKKNFKKYEQVLTDLLKKHLIQSSERIPIVDEVPDKSVTDELRELLIRTLSFGLTSLLHDDPELAEEAHNLGEALRDIKEAVKFEGITPRLREFCFKIEMKGATSTQQQKLLLRLFRLLLNNIGELLDDDSWLKGQLEVMQEMIAGPVDARALEDLESNLKEVIYKQGLLKHSLNDARESIKQLLISFIERLSYMTESTGNYQNRIKSLSDRISKTKNVNELNEILDAIMYETNAIQTDAVVSYNQMRSTQTKVEEAESRIRTLETQLEEVSGLVREDMLTGSLNRRGMEDAFEREIARAERHNTNLCVAFLDLDDFKNINETYGHLAGDDALVHLVRTVKNTLRPTDIVARYGGEEFLIIFPETTVDDSVSIMQRVQRELTRHFFMYKKQRILFTFSAGVAMHVNGDHWDAVTHRANQAMRAAKKAGKNRVFAAE